MSTDSPDLQALRRRLEEEEQAYARALDALDALAGFALPQEKLPEQATQMARLGQAWEIARPPHRGGVKGRFGRAVWNVVGPALAQQQEFNAIAVRVLSGHLDEAARLFAHLRELAAGLVRYVQRVQPAMDARDRVAGALATTRAELILESFDRRQESLARRLEGLLALRDRMEALSEEVRAPAAPAGAAPPRPAAPREDAAYAAFENRFRPPGDVRAQLASYVGLFRDRAPVVDLGCGRGEFLDLLREAGISARGVEASAAAARAARERGLEVAEGDLVDFLRAQPAGSLGGVFAAQVAEHLPPAVLSELLREAYRALRADGLLVLETVNPRSLVGFLEVYLRDLTHERPLHPETLRFLAAAAGFSEVRVELRSPVEPAARLQPVPVDGLPERTAAVLNENLDRLNALLYGPQEYALLARR